MAPASRRRLDELVPPHSPIQPTHVFPSGAHSAPPKDVRLNLARTSRLAQVGVVSLLIGAALLWLETLRFAPIPFLLVACVLYNSEKPDMRPTLLCVLAFVLLTFSPIDVLPIHTRFPPKIVPLVMGLPSHKTVERARRGEVILGGCLVSGFEPKYYLVW